MEENKLKDYIIHDGVLIDESFIGTQSEIFKFATVKESKLGFKNIVGDFSRLYNSSLGNYSRIDRNNLIYFTKLGDYTYTGSFTIIMHSKIGKFCSISWGVTIGPGEHDYERLTSHDFLYNDFYDIKSKTDDIPYNRYSKELTIGNDVWIGANSTILRGVSIGDGAVVGANSLVNKNVPPYAIVVGAPAKVVKFRFEKSIIDQLLDIKWWNLPIEIIKSNIDVFKGRGMEMNINELIKIKNSYE